MKPSKLRVFTSITNRAFLLSLLSLAACSGNMPGASESVASSDQPLLAAACDTTGGNLALTVGDGDVAYIGRIAGCTVEPCVYANAKDSSGNLCTVNSTGKTISVTGDVNPSHVEKVVFDFSNGLFAVATTTPLMSVALDGTGATSASKVMIIPPLTGGAMALGVNGLDINASTKRGTTQHLDMTIAGVLTAPLPKFEFNGGVGSDAFTGDVTNIPVGFATSAVLAAVVGAATPLNLTISGGAGADFIAGGAGTNTLLGGAGNDTFVQGTAVHAETIQGGDGVDTVDYSARTLPVFVTPNSETGVATVTVNAGGTGYAVNDTLTVTGAGTTGLKATLLVTTVASGVITAATVMNPGDGYVVAASAGKATTALTGVGTGATFNIATIGANDGQSYQATGPVAAEGDTVSSDVEIINGGSAADILNAHAVTVTDVVLAGNGGDDKLTGGAGNDDLCGGIGNDTLFENAGNDNLVGGAGSDMADYSAGTGVIACLNVADTAATKTCAAQNGGTFSGTPEQDLINGVLAKVCPRATLTVGLAAGGTAVVAPTTPGGAMTVDVENITGNATAANTMRCGTLACTVFGGSAGDTIVGSPLSDQIFGLGGNDNVTANGGSDLLDLTGSASATDTVDCGGAAVTILLGATPTLTATACTLANIP